MQYRIQNSSGKTLSDPLTYSKILLAKNIANQSFVQAICDDFFIAGVATLFCIIPLLLIKNLKKKKNMEKITTIE